MLPKKYKTYHATASTIPHAGFVFLHHEKYKTIANFSISKYS